MNTPLWISHHNPGGAGRCLRICGLHVCARCSGLLPSLLVALAVEQRHPWHLPLRLALALEVLLVVPALWDALRGLADPQSGTNGLRVASGAALGVGLGHAAVALEHGGIGAPEALLPLLACALTALVIAESLGQRSGHQRSGQLTDGAPPAGEPD